MNINKITRLLLSMAVAAMLVGFTATAQEKKEGPKKEVKPATEMKKEHKEHKKVMKTKAAVEKKEMKKEEAKKEEKKPN